MRGSLLTKDSKLSVDSKTDDGRRLTDLELVEFATCKDSLRLDVEHRLCQNAISEIGTIAQVGVWKAAATLRGDRALGQVCMCTEAHVCGRSSTVGCVNHEQRMDQRRRATAHGDHRWKITFTGRTSTGDCRGGALDSFERT